MTHIQAVPGSNPGVATKRTLPPSPTQKCWDRAREVALAPVDWNKVLAEQADALREEFGE